MSHRSRSVSQSKGGAPPVISFSRPQAEREAVAASRSQYSQASRTRKMSARPEELAQMAPQPFLHPDVARGIEGASRRTAAKSSARASDRYYQEAGPAPERASHTHRSQSTRKPSVNDAAGLSRRTSVSRQAAPSQHDTTTRRTSASVSRADPHSTARSHSVVSYMPSSGSGAVIPYTAGDSAVTRRGSNAQPSGNNNGNVYNINIQRNIYINAPGNGGKHFDFGGRRHCHHHDESGRPRGGSIYRRYE